MGDAKNQRNALAVASLLPMGGRKFPIGETGYTVTVKPMPRDEITDLALLTFAKMRPVTSLTSDELEEAEKFYKLREDIKKQPTTKFLGFSFSRTTLTDEQQKKAEKFENLLNKIQEDAQSILDGLSNDGAPTAKEIAERVQSTFLNTPELVDLAWSIQHSIRNPRSGEEAWALASQVGEPTGNPDLDKLKAPIFPAGKSKDAIKKQLDYVKQINLSNLATSLGISGFPRNAIQQIITDKDNNEVFKLTGLGTMDDDDAEKAKQVMVAAKAGVANEKDLSITGLLTESGTFASYLGWANSNLKEELGTDPILKDMAKAEGEKGFPQGVKARVVSALGAKAAGSVALLGRLQEVKEGLDSSNDPEDRYKTALKKFEARNQKYNIVSRRLLGSSDTADNRTLGIALASYIEKKALGKEVAIFCKSGKDRTGAVVNMISAIAMLDDQLKKQGKDEHGNYKEPLDLSKQANMEKLADNYRMIQQTGVRNFISGLNSEGAGVLNGIKLLPKAFKKYYESNDEGKKFLAELEVAHDLGKQNKGWKGSKQKDLEKKHDAIEGQLTDMANLEKSLQSTNPLAKFLSFVLSRQSKYDALKKQEPILRARLGIYAKGLDALKTIKANYEARDVQVAALQVIEKKEGPISKFFTAILTTMGLGGKPISSEDKAIARLEKEMNKSKKFLYGLIPKPFSSHYSDAQKASMQQIIADVKNGTIPVDGSPADLLKNIQESKAKYDLDVVQNAALKVIQEVLQKDNNAESKLLLETPQAAVIKGLEKIQSHYTSEQKKLMKPIIYCVDKELIKIDGSPADLLKNIQESKAKKAKYELDVVQQDALTVIISQIDKDSDFESVPLPGNQEAPTPEKAVIEGLEKIQSHYSSEQKAFMQQIIEGVKNETIGINGNPADLFKQIQESVVQQDALEVIKEVLSKQEPEAVILPVSQIGNSDRESEALLKDEEAPTPKQAVIEKLEEIQSHYSSEQKELMQNVIGALNEGTMTLDGNPSDEDLLNQISGAIDGTGRATIVTNPLSVDVRHMIESPPPKSHANDQSVKTVWGSLSSARKVMAHQVKSSQERDQELGGGVETGLDPREQAEKSLADPSVKSLDEARRSMKKAIESAKIVSGSHEVDKDGIVDKENKVPNENSEKNNTHNGLSHR